MAESGLDVYDIVATGNLYKRNRQKNSWTQRKIVICGQYLYQFDNNDLYKGKFDLTECSIRIVDSKQYSIPKGHYGFVVENVNSGLQSRSILFCTSTVGTLFAWLNALCEQVADFMDEWRRFLKRGEVVVANAYCQLRAVWDDAENTPVNGEERVRVLVTNMPRILILEKTDDFEDEDENRPVFRVKHQILWGEGTHPKIDQVGTII